MSGIVLDQEFAFSFHFLMPFCTSLLCIASETVNGTSISVDEYIAAAISWSSVSAYSYVKRFCGVECPVDQRGLSGPLGDSGTR